MDRVVHVVFAPIKNDTREKCTVSLIKTIVIVATSAMPAGGATEASVDTAWCDSSERSVNVAHSVWGRGEEEGASADSFPSSPAAAAAAAVVRLSVFARLIRFVASCGSVEVRSSSDPVSR